jgi:hypothetical protein
VCKLRQNCEILGSYGVEIEEYYLLGCDAVYSGRSLLKFPRNIAPRSSSFLFVHSSTLD